MKSFSIILFSFLFYSSLFAQKNNSKNDTLPLRTLDSVVVISSLKQGIPQHLASVDNTYIFDGKKTIGFYLKEGNANLAQNETRMAFAQIPGLNVWEMDGAGTQVNIGNRGTDTHRSIEMNMRQNDYITNSDIFGYPEDRLHAANARHTGSAIRERVCCTSVWQPVWRHDELHYETWRQHKAIWH